jgi:hypothetical protein
MPWPNAALDVFRPNDTGLQNPLETVLRPDGAEMDDGARAGEKAINLGSIGEIGRGDFLRRQAPARIPGYRNCADLPAAQKDEDEASHPVSRRHR